MSALLDVSGVTLRYKTSSVVVTATDPAAGASAPQSAAFRILR